MYPAQCRRGDLLLEDPADRLNRQDGRQSHPARVAVGAHPPFLGRSRSGYELRGVPAEGASGWTVPGPGRQRLSQARAPARG